MAQEPAEDWAAVVDAIRKRMRELKMSTAHLARESGLSETTVRYIGQSLSGHNRSTLVAMVATPGPTGTAFSRNSARNNSHRPLSSRRLL